MIFLQHHVENPFAHQKCQLRFSRFGGQLRSIWPLQSHMRPSSFKYHVALRSEAMRTKIFDINVRSNRVKIIDCLSPLRGCTDFAPNLTKGYNFDLWPPAFEVSEIILSANEPKLCQNSESVQCLRLRPLTKSAQTNLSKVIFYRKKIIIFLLSKL